MKHLLIRAVLLAAAVWGMLDSEVVFGEAQAVTSTGDTASTNVYDSGAAYASGNAGLTGENLWIQALCSTTPTSGGSATIQVVLQDSADNTAFADADSGAVFAYANVASGTILYRKQPPPGLRRYWRIIYRIGTAALTAGKFDAFVTNTTALNKPNASGFTVS